MNTSQVALITGSGRGIGRAMAERFASENVAVALMSRSENELNEVAQVIESAGGRALAVPTDVTSDDQVRESVARIQSTLGAIDVLINNAGSFDCIGPLWEIDPEVWWRDCEINLRGPLLTSHAVLPQMRERKSGTIINVIGGGTGNPFPFGSGYASSKAGLMRLTECVAAETREDNIVVVAMGPGFVKTRMTDLQIEGEAGQKYIPSSAQAIAAGQDVPPTLAAELAWQLAQRATQMLPLTGRLFSAGENLADVLAQQDDIIAQNKRTLRFP